jgi:hypothetical protein
MLVAVTDKATYLANAVGGLPLPLATHTVVADCPGLRFDPQNIVAAVSAFLQRSKTRYASCVRSPGPDRKSNIRRISRSCN